MCEKCSQSALGQVRYGELIAAKYALERMQQLKTDGKYAGDLAGYIQRVQAAQTSVGQLHNDYFSENSKILKPHSEY